MASAVMKHTILFLDSPQAYDGGAKLEVLLNEATAIGVTESFFEKKLQHFYDGAEQKASPKEHASLPTFEDIHSVLETLRMAAEVFDAPKLRRTTSVWNPRT